MTTPARRQCNAMASLDAYALFGQMSTVEGEDAPRLDEALHLHEVPPGGVGVGETRGGGREGGGGRGGGGGGVAGGGGGAPRRRAPRPLRPQGRTRPRPRGGGGRTGPSPKGGTPRCRASVEPAAGGTHAV